MTNTKHIINIDGQGTITEEAQQRIINELRVQMIIDDLAVSLTKESGEPVKVNRDVLMKKVEQLPVDANAVSVFINETIHVSTIYFDGRYSPSTRRYPIHLSAPPLTPTGRRRSTK